MPKPFREPELIAKLGAALALEWIEAPAPSVRRAAPNGAAISPDDLRALLLHARDGQIVPLRQRLEELTRASADPLLAEITPLVHGFQLARLSRLLEAALAAKNSNQ